MSHQSGITVGESLASAFRDAVADGANVRFIKAEIQDESVECVLTVDVGGSFDDDIGLLVDNVAEDAACYMMMRTDDAHAKGSGYEWLFVSFVPDSCPVRHKMLYASTRDTTKKALGESMFTKEIHATITDEITADGYAAWTASQDMTDKHLMSQSEIEKMEEARMEVHTGVGGAGVHGVNFPLTDAALAKVTELASGAVNYVSLSLDIDAENVDLDQAASVAVDDLPAMVPADAPRFHVFTYTHDFNGESQSPVLFYYSCPMGSKIKERMLYSSCKEAVIAQVLNAGVTIDKKIEIDEGDDIAGDVIHTTFHPPEAESKIKFAKPTVKRRRPQRKKRS